MKKPIYQTEGQASMKTHVYGVVVANLCREKLPRLNRAHPCCCISQQCFVISGITASKQVRLPCFPAYLCISSSLGAMWLTEAVKDFCACAHNPVEHLPDLALERVEPFLDGFAQVH